MASGMINPRPIAPKPAAPKTSYNTPAVIAKPAAKPSGGFGGSGFSNLPKAGSTGNKPVTGGSSLDRQIAAGFKGIKDTSAELKTLLDSLNQNPTNLPVGGDDTKKTDGLTYEELLALQKQQQEADRLLAESQKKTLALDTFKATLGLLFGKDEASKAYVGKLYSLVSGFYKTGSEVDEAINLALYQAESENAIPEFTSRFKGIFALRDAKQKGAAISVPTIAEFFATEAKMGEVLTGAGLGDLATESFLGDVIGRQKSVNEVASLISDVFNTIDYAPKELKETLSTYFPGVDRVSIARAILTGPEGAQALSQKIKGVSVLSAGAQYGIPVDLATATDIANRGFDYNSALAGFGQVSSLSRAGDLARMSGGDFTQAQAQSAVFYKDSANLSQLSKIKEVEENRFASQVGNVKGSYSTGYLSKSSGSGQF
jgi:hypothetical protein